MHSVWGGDEACLIHASSTSQYKFGKLALCAKGPERLADFMVIMVYWLCTDDCESFGTGSFPVNHPNNLSHFAFSSVTY